MNERERKKAAGAFAQEWLQREGDEKGESQSFWLSLLHDVYGVEKPEELIRFEARVKMDQTSYIDGYIEATHTLIEQKSSKRDLSKAITQSDGTKLTPFQQAKRYSIELPYSDRPRWIVLCNFREFHVFDMDRPQSEPEVIRLEDFGSEYYRLNFLTSTRDETVVKAEKVSISAGEQVGQLYRALLDQYQSPEDPETLRSLNVICVRLVFCFFADSAGLFGRRGMFYEYLQPFKDRPDIFREALAALFRVLDQKEKDRDPYQSDELLAFPYVNGGLFDEKVTLPRFSADIINVILSQSSGEFDWSEISPTVFGGVFESTLNPATRREGGMHYTSSENIHKVIDALFLNDLRAEFDQIKSIKTDRIRLKRLRELQDKLAGIIILDPAAGSGNFLTESFLSLRRMENDILREIYQGQMVMGEIENPIRVSIGQFYGIEVNDFAVAVARCALWIAEAQTMAETAEIVEMDLDFLPLKSYPNIVEGDALTLDWNDVAPSSRVTYIISNPPFVGKAYQTKEQKAELKSVFDGHKGVGKLDYVCAWYAVAVKYMTGTRIRAAFVSTNSITQGEQVSVLWSYLLRRGAVINFAYSTFVWTSEALAKAHVHCVIIGFSWGDPGGTKIIYHDRDQPKAVSHINPYLVEAPDVLITSRARPLDHDKRMVYGSMALDDGHLILSDEEKDQLINDNNKEVIRPFIGGEELISGKPRWCLWFKGVAPEKIRSMSEFRDRLQAVHDFRAGSRRKQTREAAATPYLFGEDRQPESGSMLVIPKVSSENRRYIPMAVISSDIIVNTSALLLPDCNLFEFGVLTSNVHMAWMRTVGGRLKSDYQYSNSVVYNNFPWPKPSEKDKKRIEKTAQKILDARALYPDSSLADLYDPLSTPPELIKAHQQNDIAVMTAYGFPWRTMTESECVAELMKLYDKLTQ